MFYGLPAKQPENHVSYYGDDHTQDNACNKGESERESGPLNLNITGKGPERNSCFPGYPDKESQACNAEPNDCQPSSERTEIHNAARADEYAPALLN
jgi:hypothetical protein